MTFLSQRGPCATGAGLELWITLGPFARTVYIVNGFFRHFFLRSPAIFRAIFSTAFLLADAKNSDPARSFFPIRTHARLLPPVLVSTVSPWEGRSFTRLSFLASLHSLAG